MSVPSPESASGNGSAEDVDPVFAGDTKLSPASSPARQAVRSAGESRHPAEYSRLEMLLAERAREAQEHRRELTRIKALLRDATCDFERVLAAAEPYEKIELARQRDAAVTRALDAEAARAEALFRLDELMGHLADSPHPASLSDSSAGASLGPLGDAGQRGIEQERARLTEELRGLQLELSDRRAECERAAAAQAATERELSDLRSRALAMERELEAATARQSHSEGMADALRDTRRLLSEFARAVQRVARGVSRRDAPAEAANDSAPGLD